MFTLLRSELIPSRIIRDGLFSRHQASAVVSGSQAKVSHNKNLVEHHTVTLKRLLVEHREWRFAAGIRTVMSMETNCFDSS